ncbi:MAG: Crp/Fnr family transcriptional regulator [Gammaproteobacteria bacterium]|nr:Crp/Fnr family transcriptional regulator [Gammaproteobacteria bacterium]
MASIDNQTQTTCISADKHGILASAYPQLSVISEPAWIEVINRAKLMEIPANTELLSTTTTCDNFILMLEGRVRVFQTAPDGRELTLYRIEPGGMCVLSLNSMLKEQPLNAYAVTETTIKALVMPASDFNYSMNTSVTFRNYVITTLTSRLCESMQLIQSTAFDNLNMRLACMLGGLFERNQGAILGITHQELAHELGTTREVISRILKEFEKQGCIVLSRGKIQLASAQGLEWFSSKH